METRTTAVVVVESCLTPGDDATNQHVKAPISPGSESPTRAEEDDEEDDEDDDEEEGHVGDDEDEEGDDDDDVTSETASSDASTSGVCSMASSDFDVEKPYEAESRRNWVIKYLNRDLLDLCSNLSPYGLYQTTSIPKMNMTNYWERRSVYHRLGPYGTKEEFAFERCFDCDFYETVPKW